MSKISGIDLGDPNKPFQVYGSQLGGRDQAISIQRPTANVNREKIAALAKELTSHMAQIRAAVEKLEVMGEIMIFDDDTDSIILDKNFADEYEKNVKTLKDVFEKVLRAAQQ